MWTLVIAQDVLCVPRLHLFFWTRREPFISLLPVPKADMKLPGVTLLLGI